MQLAPFLMFVGAAEEAIGFYVATFPRSRIVDIKRYGPEGPGAEGSVFKAEFEVAGTRLLAIDSPAPHPFSFTPSLSLFVDGDDRDQLDRIAAALAEGGQFLMPPSNYGFSAWFAWVQDRFGVSWQLNLPHPTAG